MAARAIADFCNLVAQAVDSRVRRKDLAECDKEIRNTQNLFQSAKLTLRAWATEYAAKENLDVFTSRCDAVEKGLQEWLSAISKEREVQEIVSDADVQVAYQKLSEQLKKKPKRTRTRFIKLSRFNDDEADCLKSNAEALCSLCEVWIDVIHGAQEPPLVDGPCHPYSWRHNCVVIEKQLQPTTWGLLNFLWQAEKKKAEFAEIAIPVFCESEAIHLNSRVGKQRATANTFFKDHGIPWKVCASPKFRRVWLERISE